MKEKALILHVWNAKGYGKTMLLISDDVIAKTPAKEEKEALHQKNRRTHSKSSTSTLKIRNAPKNPGNLATPSVDEDSEEAIVLKMFYN